MEAALMAWLVALLGDRALKGLKALALGKPERAALAIAVRVATAALLERVPPAARDSFALALTTCLAEPPHIVLDGQVTVQSAIVDGLLAQIRPLADASVTTSGRSYLSEIGVDEMQVIDELPGIVIRSIQQTGASYPALQPLAAQLNADIIQADTHQILDALQVLLARPQDRSALSLPGRPPGHLPVDLLGTVIDAMQSVPSVSDYAAWNSIINMLRSEIKGAISRSSISRIDVINTVKTCANYANGLHELLSAIRVIEGDSKAMRQLDLTIVGLTCSDLVRRQVESEPGP